MSVVLNASRVHLQNKGLTLALELLAARFGVSLRVLRAVGADVVVLPAGLSADAWFARAQIEAESTGFKDGWPCEWIGPQDAGFTIVIRLTIQNDLVISFVPPLGQQPEGGQPIAIVLRDSANNQQAGNVVFLSPNIG
ncbi:MAG: hypothetical protein L0215_09510 [Gemmataceae bacterium]|nr:hypothetical protein [Gemmataceae bacterium]